MKLKGEFMFWITIWEGSFKGASNSRVQFASIFFKLVRMSLDRGPPS